MTSPKNIALIFDHSTRPGTTGEYCLRAMKEFAEVTHFHPDQLHDADFSSFDFVLHVDDGLDYLLPEISCPSAYWAIDTHLGFEWRLERSRPFDVVFAAQQEGAEKLKQAGVKNVQWLPLGCDPEIHGKKNVIQKYDVGFVGHSFGGEREELLKLVAEKYPNSYLGQADYCEMANVYSASKIVFNRSLKNDINMRVFEALASGSLLITNDLEENGQSALFQSNKHLVTYQNAEELLEWIDYYLTHDKERKQIAAAGRKEVLDHHTYKHRMQKILDVVAEAADFHSVTASVTLPRPSKNLSYFDSERREVQAMVPLSATKILDIGCGTGRLGVGLKQRQECHVTGIEMVTDAADVARTRLDGVIVQNVEDVDFDFTEGQFDCIVCADVLEHLREPGDVLKKLKRWLTPDGSLVISLPNVRHHSVITSLLAGNWTYESAGLLDNDHVRFFTRREIEKLLYRNGFQVEQLQNILGPGDAKRKQEVDQNNSTQFNINGLQIATRSAEDAEEFLTYQYLLRATPAKQSPYGLTSIIIVTYNQLSYTHECIESIQLRTDEPYELIFVDNNSTDGTPDYLQTIEGATVILNNENRGFPAAVNQGIEAAQGDNILLLNNDVIVTTGWLRHMLDAFENDDSIGLIGPCTNNISGRQQIEVDYQQLNNLDGFAWDRGQILTGYVTDLDRLVGFCLLIKRKVIDQIGNFDEQFGIGNFEDDDFCRRAQAAGFRIVVAEASFVHHFGSVSFKASDVDFVKLMQENQKKFNDKWNIKQNQSSEKQNNKLSLCMIVRDNEEIIRDALTSIKPWVDEMIVVDTGSSDHTIKIAEELGAKTVEFPWCDDFSAARNFSLEQATGDWLFWMDSDDTIDAEQGRKLRELVDGTHQENVLGYVMQVHCPSRSSHGTHEHGLHEHGIHEDVTVVDHIKLFRNRDDLRFEHRIHEQIIPAIRRAEGDVAWTDIFVTHSGSDQTAEGHQRKLTRDFQLLHLDLEERPDHPFVLFNLGMTSADAEQPEEAILYLNRCLEVSAPQESHVRKAYALLVSSLQRLEEYAEAEEICDRGLTHYPDDAELLFRCAMLHHHFGRLEKAEMTYRAILTNRSDRHFSSTDVGIFGFKTRHNLAVVLADQQRFREAANLWQQVTESEPNFRPAWRGLAEMFYHLQEDTALIHLVEQLKQHQHFTPEEILENLLPSLSTSVTDNFVQP